MIDLPYRTNASSLTDGELILLDVLFNAGCGFQQLRDCVFKPQWNLTYSHGLSDLQLLETLKSLVHRAILKSFTVDQREVFEMTPKGGEIWSLERCPDWDRYCRERYSTTSRDRTMMTVIAVSARIRDSFLDYCPIPPARRRTTTISDFGLLPWRSFEKLHVGIATYVEQREWSSPDEFDKSHKRYKRHQDVIDTKRSWWRFVGELQRFIDDAD